ncbi:MAG: hypothetical protein GW805_08605 [Ignavibacteria bacterium]|nr:hypothetical protein [Ignavibacteria bacterium]NCS82365.1 hypothetical protein [Ignavibacteria bacterium]
MSPEKAIAILKTIYTLSNVTPFSQSRYTRLLIKNDEQAQLLQLFELDFECLSA